MTRLVLIALTLLSACGRSNVPEGGLPATVPPRWTLQAKTPLKPRDVPEVVRSLGIRQSWHGAYKGPPDIGVRLFQMSSSAGALELAQKWKREPGQVTLMEGSCFVIVEAESDHSPEISSFIDSLSRELKRGAGPGR